MTTDLWVESRLTGLESTHSVGHLSVETALGTTESQACGRTEEQCVGRGKPLASS